MCSSPSTSAVLSLSKGSGHIRHFGVGCALSSATSAVLSLSKGSARRERIVCRWIHCIGKGNVKRAEFLNERLAAQCLRRIGQRTQQ
jgi:hypothetical protein